MRKLLNTLYVTQPETYLALDGDNVIIRKDKETMGRLPLHNFEAIVCFGYAGASPGLMGYCAKRNISLTFLTQSGRFLARVIGESRGNVTLRKKQYRISDDETASSLIARNFIFGKIYNNKWIVERMTREHPLRIDVERFKTVSRQLSYHLKEVRRCDDLDSLRGWEGHSAVYYYGILDQMVLQQKDTFTFKRRTRRPPRDNMNAMMSFAYTLLANDCAAALETVGLDAYVGFMHRDRPGRVSLALDLMEELRSIYADRFVLALINRKEVSERDFYHKENGAVLMTDDARKHFLKAWQLRKQENITHPFLGERISWGLVPYVQAMLLARFLRGDLDEYPPFLWK